MQEKKRRNREKAAARKAAADLATANSITANSADQPDQVGNTLILRSVQDVALLIIATVICWMLTCHMAMPVLKVRSPAAAFIVVSD